MATTGRIAVAQIDPSDLPDGLNIHPPQYTVRLGLRESATPSCISIGSAVLQDLLACPAHTQTYTQTTPVRSAAIGRICVIHVMQANK